MKTLQIVTIIGLVVLLSSSLALAANEQVLPDVYTGTLRVYVVEIESRYLDASGQPYHNATLSIPLTQEFSLDTDELLTFTIEYDGRPWFADIEPDDIMMMAVVSNSDSTIGYSYPPDGNPYYIHNVDAAAGGTPLAAGMNEARGTFTHTVFIDETTGST